MTRKSAAPSTLRWINFEMHLQLSLIISKNYPEEKKSSLKRTEKWIQYERPVLC